MRNQPGTMMGRRRGIVFVLALVLAALFGAGGSAAAAPSSVGAVYVLTNAAAGNSVAVFSRSAGGALTPAGQVATGGRGTGGGLGSQGALVLSESGRWLFAVNAGSNDISVFSVSGDSLQLTDRVGSGGERPISLTVRGQLLYVLNAGGSGNISGFAIGDQGTLQPIAGATRPLSNGGVGPAPGPAQVQFNHTGDALVVTEKASNLIDTYAVDQQGRAAGPVTHASAGATPFGFAFDQRDHLIVSEAFGGAPGASALSSYALSGSSLPVVSSSVATTQTAACWVAVTRNGRYAYTTNAGSASVSSYAVASDGGLTLLAARAGDTGAAPTDADLSRNSQFLYVLNAGTHNLSAFAVQADGSLVSIGSFGALPAGAVGVAAS